MTWAASYKLRFVGATSKAASALVLAVQSFTSVNTTVHTLYIAYTLHYDSSCSFSQVENRFAKVCFAFCIRQLPRQRPPSTFTQAEHHQACIMCLFQWSLHDLFIPPKIIQDISLPKLWPTLISKSERQIPLDTSRSCLSHAKLPRPATSPTLGPGTLTEIEAGNQQ